MKVFKKSKKYFRYIAFSSSFILVVIFVFNIKVSTKVGINYSVYTKKIPIYVKLTNFFSRHFQFKLIAKELTENSESDKEKILKLFEWTKENIRSVPKTFPVIDDHILNIIIRGYGTPDQRVDVFTALCVYNSIPAFWNYLTVFDQKGIKRKRLIAYVKWKNKWRVFDPITWEYFLNKNGDFASTDELLQDRSLVKKQEHYPPFRGLDYIKYYDGLKNFRVPKILRSELQMPLRRFLYEVKTRIFSIK